MERPNLTSADYPDILLWAAGFVTGNGDPDWPAEPLVRGDDLARAHAASPLPDLAQQLLAAWPPLTPGLHPLHFEGGRVELLLGLGDARELLRELVLQADAIYLAEIRSAGLYDAIWQAFAVLLPVKTVGVMGDYRTYDSACALGAVTSTDGMTADVDDAVQVAEQPVVTVEERGAHRSSASGASRASNSDSWFGSTSSGASTAAGGSVAASGSSAGNG